MRSLGLLVGPPAAVIVYLVNPGGQPPQARRLLAILALTVAFWVTEAIPLPATALLSSALAIIWGVAPARAVLGPYAEPVIFLFVGTFLLAEAFRKFGLDQRVAARLVGLKRVGRSRSGRILGVGGAAAILSMWLSNTASAALMTPIALGVVGENPAGGEAEGPKPRWRSALLLMVAYGASLGGVVTLIGTPPNLLTAGFLDRLCGVRVEFFPWMLFGLPIGGALFVIAFLWLRLLFLRGAATASTAPTPPAALPAPSGPAAGDRIRRRGARLTLGALSLAVILWALPSLVRIAYGPTSAVAKAVAERLPEAGVALLCATLLFLAPIDWRRRHFALSWREGRQVNWGIILLFGGGLSLGTLAQSTGVARWVGEGLSSFRLAQSGAGLLLCAIALAILMTELASNTACATLLVPIVIAAAQASGLDPVRPALGVALAASCSFMFPVATPPNAIVFGSGHVPLHRMIGTGVVLELTAIFTIWGGLLLLTPVLPR